MEKGWQRRSEWCHLRRTMLPFLALTREGPPAKEYRQPRNTGKARKQILSLPKQWNKEAAITENKWQNCPNITINRKTQARSHMILLLRWRNSQQPSGALEMTRRQNPEQSRSLWEWYWQHNVCIVNLFFFSFSYPAFVITLFCILHRFLSTLPTIILPILQTKRMR